MDIFLIHVNIKQLLSSFNLIKLLNINFLIIIIINQKEIEYLL